MTTGNLTKDEGRRTLETAGAGQPGGGAARGRGEKRLLVDRPPEVLQSRSDSPPLTAAPLSPPSWSVGSWSSCSRTCGGGTQSREVQCTRRAHYRSERVPAPLCPQPAPSGRQACQPQSCPPAWSVGPWAQVTPAGAGGGMRRQLGPAEHRAGFSPGRAQPGPWDPHPQGGPPGPCWALTVALSLGSAREPAGPAGGSGPWPAEAPAPRPGHGHCPTPSAARSPGPGRTRPACGDAAARPAGCSGWCRPGPRYVRLGPPRPHSTPPHSSSTPPAPTRRA